MVRGKWYSSRQNEVTHRKRKRQPKLSRMATQNRKTLQDTMLSLKDPSLKPPADRPNHYRVKSTYWYDIKTKEKTWVKPSILKYVGMYQKLLFLTVKKTIIQNAHFAPSGEDTRRINQPTLRLFTVSECDEVFAPIASRKAILSAPNIIEPLRLKTCDMSYQVATRKCFGCGPPLLFQCDSCFHSIHNS